MTDPILTPSSARLQLFPIKYDDLWKMYKNAEASFWTSEELVLSDDHKDWVKLTDDERHLLKMVLGYFAQADNLVVENLAARFLNDVQIPEARAFWTFQGAMEQIHAETYALLIDEYVKDPEEKDALFRAPETIPAVKLKTDWATKWIESNDSFPERLIGFAAVEGIQFSASFAVIFWLKKRGLMPGLCTSNALISRDEAMHRDFACMLYKKLRQKPSQAKVQAIVREATEAELAFVDDALPVAVIGLNADSLKEYVRYVADHLLQALGCEPLYGAKCGLDFMEQLSLQNKANYFELRETSYAKAGVANREKREFKLEEDF
ncbi:hypothetical protein WJX74_008075 [Apatococcus lobatus]|uniref:Uncharacterized protein n=1 Tax=Apatococcus lobatus TaxID=904363 RepID=A0AAW1R0M6_9CHLO